MHFPIIVVGLNWLRNPAEKQIIRSLVLEELLDNKLVHEQKQQRFLKYMHPQDAFVSYRLNQTNGLMLLTHIEIPSEKRGSGFGADLAIEVFEFIENMNFEAKVVCPFLKKIAKTNTKWQKLFKLK